MPQFFEQLRHYTKGIRFYLILGIIVVTLEVWWWGTAVFGSTELSGIRIQEVYAWLSILFLCVTLLIGPATKIFSQLPGKQLIRESRRMIGIGGAWFGLLHAAIVYLKQFRGAQILQLPRLYQQSIVLGIIALIALTLLALTSFNQAMKTMGVWWFRLHRLVYVSALAALMHAFMIGAHATSAVALGLLAAVAAVWVGANIYLLVRSSDRSFWRIVALGYGTALLIAVLSYGVAQHRSTAVDLQAHAEQRQ
jgi:DMSO/TMAO reductase YedYZ heme-binding membrane subunit